STLARRFRLFINGITMSSSRPLICIGYLGLFIIILSSIYTMMTLFQYLFHGDTVDGWTSLIISIWFLGGLPIFSLGIIAVYLSVMFEEVKKRPYSIIKRIHRGGQVKAEALVEL